MFLTAFSPMASDDLAGAAPPVREAGEAAAPVGSPENDLDSPAVSGDYDALHTLQSGLRSSEEIQNDISTIAGQGLVFRWNGEFWQKNKIAGTLTLVTILSHVQNLETRSEVMHVLTLPGENRHESSITLFTDRLNAADVATLHSTLLIARLIRIVDGRPVYDPKDSARFNFHLGTSDLQAYAGDLREPEGAYELSAATTDENSVDPFSELSQNNGSFDELGNYEYDQDIDGRHRTVSITPRWNAAARSNEIPSLSLEVQIHEAESLDVRSFVLVYQ